MPYRFSRLGSRKQGLYIYIYKPCFPETEKSVLEATEQLHCGIYMYQETMMVSLSPGQTITC